LSTNTGRTKKISKTKGQKKKLGKTEKVKEQHTSNWWSGSVSSAREEHPLATVARTSTGVW
jgi:hypothetical protein